MDGERLARANKAAISEFAAQVGSDTLTTTAQTVTGAVNEVNSAKANRVQEAWIEPTLLNSWVENDAARRPKYLKDNFGRVELIGSAKSGVIGQVIYVLPVGYRHNRVARFVVNSNNSAGMLMVDTNGNVTLEYGNNAFMYFDGVSFLV
jgi:hypothetical protein